MAIPLCIPNNYEWDSKRRKCIKTGDERSSLYVVEEALQKLRQIKGPVCVVSIAGPYRKGKSYILSEAFDQPQVFPLGHEMVAETMGIWMWILPGRHEDSSGKKFSVVLLDSEGIDSAMGTDTDDNQIFTLTVLLSSVLIYNSQGVPTRRDLEGLDYIANLSRRIQIRSNAEADAGDADIFHKIFPFFIWLLRDVTQSLPSDCKDIKEYFLTKVFEEQNSSPTSDRSEEVATSILNFFSGFDAFTLPPPTVDPAVLRTISDNKSQLNPSFVRGIQQFKLLLKKTLAPKKSPNVEEDVSGEALAHLVSFYIEVVNTPGAIPKVQNAWNAFEEKKCSDVKRAALETYKNIMKSELSGKLPCDSGEIRKGHSAALAECENMFMAETEGLLTNTVEKRMGQLNISTDETLQSWQDSNANSTREFCNDLIEQLKKRHLDSVLQQLKGKEAAELSIKDITGAYEQLKKEYSRLAIGVKEVITAVFFDHHMKLNEEMKQYLAHLKKLKDYDKKLAQEMTARAYQEQEKARLQEEKARLQQENDDRKNKMEHLIKKQKKRNGQIASEAEKYA